MKIVLEVDKERIISTLETTLRRFIRFLYGWFTTDGQVLGYILGVSHFVIAITIFILLLVSYTIYPALWLQAVVLLGLFLIWLQHVVLKVCVSTIAEERLTNEKAPFFIILHDLTDYFGIPFDRCVENIVIAETVAVLSLILAFIGRISVMIHDTYGIPY